MPDWTVSTRLAVSYTDEDGKTVDVTPIDQFVPSFSLNAEPLHSLEQTHIGVIYSPQAMSFSLTVRAIGDVAAKLTALALQGKRFDITLQTDSSGVWAFDSIVMSQCIITSATPTSAVISGAPTATFSGFSLGAKAESSVGTQTIP
jgi:hypothetical protein